MKGWSVACRDNEYPGLLARLVFAEVARAGGAE